MVEEWVEEIRERLKRIKERIEELEKKVRELDDRVGQLENIAVVMMVRDTDRAIEEEEKVEEHEQA